MRVLVRHYPGQGWLVENESVATASGPRVTYRSKDEAVNAAREHWPDHDLEIVNEAIVPRSGANRLT
jgi:hypothetical protein